jgi:hypothetical protein
LPVLVIIEQRINLASVLILTHPLINVIVLIRIFAVERLEVPLSVIGQFVLSAAVEKSVFGSTIKVDLSVARSFFSGSISAVERSWLDIDILPV